MELLKRTLKGTFEGNFEGNFREAMGGNGKLLWIRGNSAKFKGMLNGSLNRLRVGIKPEGKIIAREGVKIFSKDGEEIGLITSGTFGPSVNGSIAMGYIKLNFSKPETIVFLEVRGKKYEAKTSGLPFYKKNYVR